MNFAKGLLDWLKRGAPPLRAAPPFWMIIMMMRNAECNHDAAMRGEEMLFSLNLFTAVIRQPVFSGHRFHG